MSDNYQKSTKPWQRFPILISTLIITFFLLISYSNSFTTDWHYDDFHHIKENINIRKASNIPLFFKDPSTFSRNPQTNMYRPLLMTTYAINYQMGLASHRDGYYVLWYHITNFLFHLFTTFSVFFITFYLFRKKIPIEGLNPLLPGLFAGLLFGLNTINTETIVYISSRSSAMATAFVLLAFFLYLKATDTGKVKAIPLIFSAFLYGCGLLSKEIAITLPAMILYYEFLLNREELKDSSTGKNLTTMAFRMVPYLIAAGGYLTLRSLTRGEQLLKILTSKGGTAAAPDLTAQLATQSRAWVYYIREILLPTGLSIDKPFRVSRDFSDPMAIISLLIIAGIIIAVILLRKRHPVVTFGTLWFFTALLPTSIFRLNIVINDHRLYLPGFGFVLIFTYVVSRLYVRFKSDGGRYYKGFVTICIAILILMGLGTYKRNMAFATEETMWRDVILKDKKSVRGYNNLGIYYEQQKDFDKAIKFYQRTVKLAPMFPNPYINLGNVYHKKKQYDLATKYMKRAIRLDPRSALANYNLGNILREAGKTDEAIAAYNRALNLNPRYIEAANNLANIHFKKREFPQAIEYYRKALFIDPTFAMSHYNIGLAYEHMGQYDRAIEAFETFERYWLGDPKYRATSRAKIQRLKKMPRTKGSN